MESQTLMKPDINIVEVGPRDGFKMKNQSFLYH